MWDPLGRLFEVYGPSTGTTRLVYDGDQLALEYDGAGTLLRRHAHGPGEDDPLMTFEGMGVTASQGRALYTDHLGSVTAVVSQGGSVLGINGYDEYGIPASTNLGRFQYTGQAWIPELGMYHYKARIYSPTLGRFLQTDPIGYDDQINLYAYVGNDPANGTDSTGESENCVDNGDETQTCTITVTANTLGGLLGIAILQAGASTWNGGYRIYRGARDFIGSILYNEKANPNKNTSDEAWDEIADSAETGADGQKEKPGGKEAADRDFDALKGKLNVKSQPGKGVRTATLPDGTRVVVRPSRDGRWTVERQSPSGLKPRGGSSRIIRYRN